MPPRIPCFSPVVWQFSRPIWSLGILLGILIGCGNPGTPPATSSPGKDKTDTEIKVQPVKLAAFEDRIKEHKGKVVLVDFWADFCIPCKVAFPDLIALQKRYEGDGLVLVTVNLDDPTDEEALQRAVQFLQKQKAQGIIHLGVGKGEQPDSWYQHYKFETIPHKQLYDRAGNRQDLSGVKSDADLEALVKVLLAKK